MKSNRYGFCIVLNGAGDVLVIKRSSTARHRPGEWDLAGGFLLPDEDVVVGVEREVFEETGLSMLSMDLVIHKSGNWNRENHAFYYYRGLASTTEVRLSYEHDDYAWHSLEIVSSMVQYGPHLMACRHLVDTNALTVQ